MWQRLNIDRDEAKRISAVATGIFGIKWRYDPDSTLILLGQTLNGSPGFDVDGVVVDGNGLPYRSMEEFVARHAQAVLQLLETGAWVLDPPADAEHAAQWKTQYDLSCLVAADPDNVLGEYYDIVAAPMNMLIDLCSMEILYSHVGFDAGALRVGTETHLGL